MTLLRIRSLQPLVFCGGLVLWLLVLPSNALSTELTVSAPDSISAIQSAPKEPATFDYGAAMVRTAESLAIVLLLLALMILGIKWLQRKSLLGRGASEVLCVVSTLNLGPKRNVTLIKIADRVLVVGSSEAGLALLAELSKEEAAAVLSAKGKLASSFASTLASHLSPMGRAKT